jgi:hypothetical protein
MKQEITVVACANAEPTQPYLVRGFHAFKESSRKFGFEPLILGWNEPWGGLGSKPKLLKRAIESGQIDTEYIIFADAFDVVFSESPLLVLDVWHEAFDGNPVLWNAELSCFPNQGFAQCHPETNSPFRYLNSGLSIGKTSDYLAACQQMKVDEWLDDHRKPDGSMYERNDQNDWMEKFLFGQCADDEPKMILDTDCVLLQTICGVPEDWIDIEYDGNIYNNKTLTYPIAFHFNGPAKTSPLFDKILSHLGY